MYYVYLINFDLIIIDILVDINTQTMKFGFKNYITLYYGFKQVKFIKLLFIKGTFVLTYITI